MNTFLPHIIISFSSFTSFPSVDICPMPPSRGGSKVFAVRRGRLPGVYRSYPKCREQVDGFPGAVWKSCYSEKEAWDFCNGIEQKARLSDDTGPLKSLRPAKDKKVLVTLSDDEDTIDATLSIPDDRIVPTDNDLKLPPRPVPGPSSSTSLPTTSAAPITTAAPSNAPVAADAEDPPLSPQQQAVLDRALAGENLFFTGSAGTGKSLLLRALIKALRYRHGSVAVTASTGIAALNIGGCTLHSWAGIGLGDKPVENLVQMIQKSRDTRNRWRFTRVLIVDEVSMILAELLDKLDLIGRILRRVEKPFGGIQIILCGDFFQLPPINDDRRRPHGTEGRATYAFDAKCWDKTIPRTNIVTLQTVFRQQDGDFVACLENVRVGSVSDQHDELLKTCERQLDCADGIKPIRLRDVDRENIHNLDKLPRNPQIYMAEDRGGVNSKGFPVTVAEATNILNKFSRWPEELPVKIGAQVMLVTNWKSSGLVNGSTGRVEDFMTVKEASDAGVWLDGDYASRFLGDSKWPVIRFKKHKEALDMPDRVLVTQMDVTVENANGGVECARSQVPLILAWAITIHKAQGLTLEKVLVDLNGAFDCGQAYVALSRVTSLEGLQLTGYHRGRVMTSRRVLDWATEMAEDDEWDAILGDAVLDY